MTKRRLEGVKQRALVIAGERDLLIPSASEAERLSKALPRCRKVVLPGRSHAVLQEAGVDLIQILQSQGFYVTERALSNGRASTSATDGGATAFGTPAPVQLPTPQEIKADEDGFVTTIRRFCSPVYYSTAADGRVVRGFRGLPTREGAGAGRPVLFIGNHQLFAADMYTVRWWVGGWVGWLVGTCGGRKSEYCFILPTQPLHTHAPLPPLPPHPPNHLPPPPDDPRHAGSYRHAAPRPGPPDCVCRPRRNARHRRRSRQQRRQ